jgi:hypothetical protein
MNIINRILSKLSLIISKTHNLSFYLSYHKLFLISLISLISIYQLPAQSLSGEISALSTEKYLEGATVELKGSIHQTIITDQGGNFNFDNLLPGKYSLYITCIGFES